MATKASVARADLVRFLVRVSRTGARSANDAGPSSIMFLTVHTPAALPR
ncbi:hypothetical protein ACVILH_006440 [Bradyrhizobium sp. USDA 4353]